MSDYQDAAAALRGLVYGILFSAPVWLLALLVWRWTR